MTHYHDGVSAARHGLGQVICRGPGPQRLDWLRLGSCRAGDRVGRLAGAQQRAREHRVGCDTLLREARAELSVQPSAVGRQPPQLVRFALLGLCMAYEASRVAGYGAPFARR